MSTMVSAHRGLTTFGGALVIFGSFRPWVVAGSVERSSFQLLDLMDRWGLGAGGAFATGVRWWPLVPLLVVVTVVATWWGWTWVMTVAGVGAVCFPILVASGTLWAPPVATISVTNAPVLTAVGAAVLGAGLVLGIRGRANSAAGPMPP